MNETLLVFSAEFMRKLRSRVFIFATLAGLLAIAAITELPTLISTSVRSSTDKLVLAGPPDLRARAVPALEQHKAFQVVAQLDALPQPMSVDVLNRYDKAAAALALSVSGKRLQVDIYPRDLGAFDDVQLRQLIPLSVEVATGAPPAVAKGLIRVQRTLHPLDKKFVDESSARLARALALGLVFVLYFSIILAVQSILSAVAEEKTNRIAEILVATISPANLLTGKIFAATALAVMQIAIWVGGAALTVPHSLLAMRPSEDLGAPEVLANATPAFIDPGVLVAFGIFFVLGYLQFATLYAAAGSLVSKTEDLGMVSTPMVLPVVAAFFVAQFALVDPNSLAVQILSFVPLVSPFVIFTRIAVAVVPAWQVALAVAVNAAVVVATFFIAGRVYRVGMLLYGRLPSPRQVWNALRVSG